ncbi:uncharacterized protein FA14DRAFT_160922 [Meira miltonrushii]|uniref:Uncharacterized protein n=1 Tax=Meira miltonrushii TaxID=1280837 RepID=A0A316VKH1_9BASI|nr:uncharacterized protein FA14DRAFT_160922 [Meira miltonrushii]PWN36005.1 hypothetical protein FA14DRAFT_160922 [Meira miltonrushii]
MQPEKAQARSKYVFITASAVLALAVLCGRHTFATALDSNTAHQQYPHVAAVHQQRQQGHVVNMQSDAKQQNTKSTYQPSQFEEDDDEVEFQSYIPSSERRTLAEELRAARQAERARAARKLKQEKASSQAEKKSMKAEEDQSHIPDSIQNKPTTKAASKGIRKGISAVRSAGRQVKSTMHHYLDHDDEYEYVDEDGEVISDADGWQEIAPAAATRLRRRRKVNNSKSFIARVMAIVPHIFKSAYAIALWMSRNVVWTPMTYIGGAVSWSAHTSWQTTTWAGERALVGPARTVTAPFVYLIEGLLFIFVWIPARAIKVVVRELYPVYVFLGAALAVGTAMGIAAAVVLYVGSFVFGDRSKLESSLYERGERLPREMEQYVADSYRTAEKRSNGRKTKRNGSIIEEAIRESLQREERLRANGHIASPGEEEDEGLANERDTFGFERAWKQGEQVEDSDEDDDYFGTTVGSNTFKGKDKSPPAQQNGRRASYPIPSIVTSNGNSAPSNSAYAKSIPVGATGHGGWGQRSDSNSSTPIASPVYTRSNVASPYAYTSSRASPVITPSPTSRVGPDAIRSHHSRQRRNVPAASPVA